MIKRFAEVTSYLHMISAIDRDAARMSRPKYYDAAGSRRERNCMLHPVRRADGASIWA